MIPLVFLEADAFSKGALICFIGIALKADVPSSWAGVLLVQLSMPLYCVHKGIDIR